MNCYLSGGIENRMFGVILDNASSNDVFVDMLRT